MIRLRNFTFKLVFLIILFSCLGKSKKIGLTENSDFARKPTISEINVLSNNLIFEGNNLNDVQSVLASSANLEGYTFSIQSRSSSSLILNVLHQAGSALELAADTLYSFLLSSAHAQTVVNVSISVIPTNAIMAFNGPCPSGWSQLDGSGSLPDARGRTLIGAGQGTGLTDRIIGNQGGAESIGLNINNLPAHSHSTDIEIPVNSGLPTTEFPSNSVILSQGSSSGRAAQLYSSNLADTTLSPFSASSSIVGSSSPINIMQPYLVVTYCTKN